MPPIANHALSAYRQTEAQSRTPLELVVMLYDGAIRFTRTAQAAAAKGDVVARGEAISRVLAIISELQSTLDLKTGGDVAVELDRLYHYVNGRLMDASFSGNAQAFDDVCQVLSPLRDAWGSIASGPAAAAVKTA